MSQRYRVRDGEFGWKLNFVTGYNATGFTTAVFTIVDPNGVTYTKTANTLDAAAGDWFYTTEAGVFGNSLKGGVWQIQLAINFTGKTLKTETVPFPVGKSLA